MSNYNLIHEHQFSVVRPVAWEFVEEMELLLIMWDIDDQSAVWADFLRGQSKGEQRGQVQ